MEKCSYHGDTFMGCTGLELNMLHEFLTSKIQTHILPQLPPLPLLPRYKTFYHPIKSFLRPSAVRYILHGWISWICESKLKFFFHPLFFQKYFLPLFYYFLSFFISYFPFSAVWGLCCCLRDFSGCGVWASHCGGLSMAGKLQQLLHTGSRAWPQ